MYTPAAFWFTLALPLLFVLYTLTWNRRYGTLPHEAISVAAVFSALIIGFIVASAMGRYDTFVTTQGLFNQKIAGLIELVPEHTALLQQVQQAYDQRQGPEKFHQLTQVLLQQYTNNNYIHQTLAKLEELINVRATSVDALSPLLWFAVFVPMVVMSIFLVLDARLNQVLTLLVLLIIWLPVLIVYYLYSHREG